MALGSDEEAPQPSQIRFTTASTPIASHNRMIATAAPTTELSERAGRSHPNESVISRIGTTSGRLPPQHPQHLSWGSLPATGLVLADEAA